MCSCLGNIEKLTDCLQQLAQKLNLFLFGILNVAQELLDTLVHDMFRKHLKLEKFTDELDETETLTCCPLSSVILLRIDLLALLLVSSLGGFGRISLRRRLFGKPATLKVFLKAIEEILPEELTPSDRLALGIPHTIVLDFGTDRLHHLPAEPRIHFVPCGFMGRPLEHEPDGCMQNLSHLCLLRVLPGSRLISGTTFSTSQKINLPRLSRLQIDDSLSTVIAFLSCVNIPPNTKVKLGCYCQEDTSVDHYMMLSSQRFHASAGGLAMSTPSIRSLVLELGGPTPRLTLSALECDHESYSHHDDTSTTDWGRNIPLQIDLRADFTSTRSVSSATCTPLCP